MVDSDAAISALGRWNKWQLIMYCLTCVVVGFAAAWHMLAIVFIGLSPTVHCKVPDGIEFADAIPPNENNDGLHQCQHYANFSNANNETVEGCPLGWHYSDDVWSIVNEWETVCDRKYLVTLSQTILVVGVMLGAMVMSSLADRFGRKVVLLSSVLSISLCGFLNAWVTHYWMFCVVRFFIGVFQQGIVLPGFVYACELFPASDRTVAGLLMQLFWGVGMFILALLAYLIRNWRHLMLAISVPGVLVIPLFWFLPESIPWLVARGRIREAKEILNKAAKMNNVTLPKEFQLTDEDEQLLDETPKKEEERRSSMAAAARKMSRAAEPDGEVYQYSCLDIARSKKLLMYSLIMAYIWCVSALVYYGLSLSTGSLAGSPYLNFFLSGLVELPAYIICAVVLQLVGRRWPIFSFHLIAGIPLFMTLFIPKVTSGGTDLSGLIVALAMIGKFGITGCFGSVFLYAPELYPTTVRSLGIGIASVGSRVGNLVSPQTELIMDWVPWLPNVVFGVMCIIAGVVTLILPETLGRALPQTIKEVEHWTRTLSPEEKEQFKAAKRAEKEKRKALVAEMENQEA